MSESLNCAIEIHDSLLKSVETSGTLIKLFFEAYIHKSKGIPGVDPGTGWVQNVVLKIKDGSLDGLVKSVPCDLMDGSLEINEEHLSNEIPIPLDRSGKIALTLLPKWAGERLVARGTHVSLELLGEARYIEDVR